MSAALGDRQLRADGYMAAWMLRPLQGAGDAAKVFAGDDAEILADPLRQDNEKNR